MDMKGPAADHFEDLLNAYSKEDIAALTLSETAALLKRGKNLDIFVAQFDKSVFSCGNLHATLQFAIAPTQAEPTVRLTQEEHKSKGTEGSVKILVAVLAIEDIQSVAQKPGNTMLMELRSDLRATARSIKDCGTAAAANKLEDRRCVLRAKIRALSDDLKKWASASQERLSNDFCGESFELEEDLLAEFREEQPDVDPVEDSDDEDGYKDDEEDLLSVVDSGDLFYNTLEDVSLWCPSHDPTFQNENIQYQELSLRESQAAACIESICQCIGQKSLLIKALVRRY
jgi:hypothetical protein